MITALTSLFVALVLFFGGAGATTYAAQGALPGDALYTVKAATEDLRLVFMTGSAGDARLYNEFVQRRVGEIDSLADKGRYADIPVASTRLEAQVRQVALILAAMAGEDPVQAQDISTRLRQSLALQAQLKSRVQNGQAGFEFLGIVEAMESQAWTISGETVAISTTTSLDDGILVGDLVKVAARLDGNGVLTATEIERIDNGGKHDFILSGIIEAMAGQSWIVAGRTVLITPQTEIKDSVVVGDFIKIKGLLAIDGDLVARQIQLAGDDANGNDDDDHGNGNGDDDANGNDDDANGNDDDDANGNDDDDDANGNEDDDDDDDDANGNDDDDANGNDDDDDANGNDDDDANGNDDDDENGNGSIGGNDDDDDDDGNSSGGGDDDDDDDGNGFGGGDDDDDDAENGSGDGGGGNDDDDEDD